MISQSVVLSSTRTLLPFIIVYSLTAGNPKHIYPRCSNALIKFGSASLRLHLCISSISSIIMVRASTKARVLSSTMAKHMIRHADRCCHLEVPRRCLSSSRYTCCTPLGHMGSAAKASFSRPSDFPPKSVPLCSAHNVRRHTE